MPFSEPSIGGVSACADLCRCTDQFIPNPFLYHVYWGEPVCIDSEGLLLREHCPCAPSFASPIMSLSSGFQIVSVVSSMQPMKPVMLLSHSKQTRDLLLGLCYVPKVSSLTLYLAPYTLLRQYTSISWLRNCAMYIYDISL